MNKILIAMFIAVNLGIANKAKAQIFTSIEKKKSRVDTTSNNKT